MCTESGPEVVWVKITNYTGLKNTLSLVWAGIGSVEVRELEINLYQFVFATHADKLKILNGKASTFDSQFLLLQPWDEVIDFCTASFNTIHL